MQRNWYSHLAPIAVVLLSALFQARTVAGESFVQWTENPGSFPIASGDGVAAICIDGSDWPGVARAARDLRDDIKRVTGKEPALETAFDKSRGKNSIIIGTLGHSALVDQLAKEGKIDAAAIQGKWESYLIEVVPNPAAGVESALRDRRQRQARDDLWHLRSLAANRRLALVLVGRCADGASRQHLRQAGQVHAGAAGGEISRHLFERRSTRAFWLGARKIRPGQAKPGSAGARGRGEHEPRVLRPRVRVAAPAARQLSLAGDVEQRLQRRRSGKSQTGR